MTPPTQQTPLASEFAYLIQSAKAPRLRSMREFAEAEIVIPDGPHAGEKFRCSTQPYSGLFFDAVDSEMFTRFVALGPTQSGKTLASFNTPIMYHLFEMVENVVAGVPDMSMAGDKWSIDIKPVIERTRYRDLLPTSGPGSRDGVKIDKITFKNGAILKFMSGGGSDKSRAGFTSRVLVVTETDGMDESGGTSRESDKITQLEGRLRSWNRKNQRTYLECTVSIEQGRTWQEYQKGSQSRIVLHCHGCGAWVSPEREHLVGWKDSEDELDADDKATFICPTCNVPWSEKQRLESNRAGKLLHRGQEIDASGEIIGDPPRTRTLGFRWSAVNNMFQSAGDVGADEWNAAQAIDQDNAEKEMRQFVWALPYDPEIMDISTLDARTVEKRRGALNRGMVPKDTDQLVVGVDVGKWKCNWTALAWRESVRGIVPDYGILDVPTRHMDEDLAIKTALNSFADELETGWARAETGEIIIPSQVWIDSGYAGPVVYAFCKERGPRYRPVKGWGAVKRFGRGGQYSAPKDTGKIVRYIGDGYHFAVQKKDGIILVHINVDEWKTWVHRRFGTPLDEEGSLVLYNTPERYGHMEFATSLASERQVEEESPSGKGPVIKWEVVQRGKNHYLDSITYAAAALHFAGARLVKAPPMLQQAPAPLVQMPGGATPFILRR